MLRRPLDLGTPVSVILSTMSFASFHIGRRPKRGNVFFLHKTTRARTVAKVPNCDQKNSDERRGSATKRYERMRAALQEENSLFRVVCGVREDAREESPMNAIGTLDNGSVLVSGKKFRIQNDFPCVVHQLTATMSKERGLGRF